MNMYYFWPGAHYRRDTACWKLESGLFLTIQPTWWTSHDSDEILCRVSFEKKDPKKRWKRQVHMTGVVQYLRLHSWMEWPKLLNDPTPYIAEMVL